MELCIKRIGQRGEVVIPKEIREERGLTINSKIEIIPIKNAVLLMPVKKKLRDLAGLFGSKGVNNIEELDAITHELLGGIGV